ncbi:MAG: metallophosphoesterase [Nitrospirae bacterium]|nr:metallophosphoesterase [Nitrospirota bacterium]
MKPDSAEDYIIVSDLHLGPGRNPSSGRYFHLENFFFDQEFLLFCRFLIRKARERKRTVKLIINGDFVDLLRIDRVDEQHRERFRLKGARGGVSRLGYATVLEELEAKMDAVVRGHAVFFKGLAELLDAGQQVIILPGNHDHELQIEPLRNKIRGAVSFHLGANSDALNRLCFRSWFFHVPGLLWVEHGHQYDTYNAFDYLIKPELPSTPCGCYPDEIDLPFGSYFQRYLYNRFGQVTFVVPGRRSNAQYFLWLLVNRPSAILRAAFWYGPLFFKMAKPCVQGHQDWEKRVAERHRGELKNLAEESGLGANLERIESMKEPGGHVSLIVERIFKRVVLGLASALGGTALTLWLWFLAQSVLWSNLESGWARSSLFVLTNILLVTLLLSGLVFWLYRTMKREPKSPYRQAAAEIARLAGVRFVVFGHTHSEDICPIPEASGWHFNTGTWITTFTAFRIEPRERIQFTYLEILDGRADLMSWSPEVERPKPAVLLEED